MRSVPQPRRTAPLALAGLILVLELATVGPAASFAQTDPSAQPTPPPSTQSMPPTSAEATPQPTPKPSVATDAVPCPGTMGPADYAVSGGPTHAAGWFYTEEACRWAPIGGLGPTRARGFAVVDDDKGNFWTEFRRFGGIEVLGYPVSQPYHYPVGSTNGYWYQAFERAILQYHPETGRAEMANAFEQFTESDPCHADRPDDACMDNKLAFFGIPPPQSTVGSPDASFDPEQRMSWLTEPRFLARYFFDPVAFHSSDPQRAGDTAFATQEQAWAFFGLPQGAAQRMVLRMPNHPSQDLWPLLHSFSAQRFQKGGMQLFMEDLPPAVERYDLPMMNGDDNGQLFDPTIVPGDGKKGCVALTAVGLLARTIGIDRMIPRTQLEPVPADPHPRAFFTTYVPTTNPGQFSTQFQIDGTGYGINEPITILLSDGITAGTPTLPGRPLPSITVHVDRANDDGSFTQVVTARIGTYTLTITGDKSANVYAGIVDLTVASVNLILNRPTNCQAVGLPVAP